VAVEGPEHRVGIAPVQGMATGLRAGVRVAGYRVERQIGAGGMAEVYLARDERLGRLVALKVMSPAMTDDETFRLRFIRESRAAAAVDDPHIIPVYEAGAADGVLFIAIRFVSGGDVRSLVRREGPLSAAWVMPIISAVASALDAAHATGLVHRDVKPANMLLDSRASRADHVYLSDFGLSKDMQSGRLTGTGDFMGTPSYTAPEQITGQHVDGRADQYALACSAFEMLSGDVPFAARKGWAEVYAHLNAPAPTLTDCRPDLHPAVNQVFARAMAKEPRDRYESCRQFSDALNDALRPPSSHIVPSTPRRGMPVSRAASATMSGKGRPPTPPTRSGRERRTRPLRWWQYALVTLVVLAVLTVLVMVIGSTLAASTPRT
jgi:serine/threonine protein kinase